MKTESASEGGSVPVCSGSFCSTRRVCTVFTLDQILGLVGTLDDAPGNDPPRERFRDFLRHSVGAIGAVRDDVEACTKNKGPQYDHALHGLVNHIGALIGFDVEYGRYKGVANDIGHDGRWRWNDYSIVVDVTTTDAFTIKTEALGDRPVQC